MPEFVRTLQPPLNFIPPAYNRWVVRMVHWALPLLLRVRVRPWLPAGISRVEVRGIDYLVDLYAQFEAGEARFLMAARHVEIDDPLGGLYLCSRSLNRAAKARGIKLTQPVHTHFVYERGMTIWGGRGLGWLLSRMGGVPIRRGRRPDWVGLKAARKVMLEGDMPLVIAPEGATNGHSERIGPLEPGVAQLGFWCAEDLARSQRSESVFIVPMGIQYHYEAPNWPRLAQLLDQLEAKSGLEPLTGLTNDAPKACYLRILRLGEKLMTTMEAFYSRNFHRCFDHDKTFESDIETNLEACSVRLQALLDKALGVSEAFFNLPGKGNLVDRCRRVEEASWSYIYREDLAPRHQLSPLERGLADWVAQEASLRELHMRMVESFVAVDGYYLSEKPSFERCAETALLISDILARLGGDKLPGRPRLGDRRIQITIAPPIPVTPRLPDYQKNRRAGRVAVEALTEEIRQALEESIER